MCWRLGGTKGAQSEQGIIILSMEKGTKINCDKDFFANNRIISAVKRVEFVSDRMSYIILRGCWCNIIVWNVHAPSDEKSNDSKDSFYKELEQALSFLRACCYIHFSLPTHALINP